MIKKIGKIGKLNAVANKMLNKLWIEKDVRWCELPIPHECSQGMGLTNCHRHKRIFYRSKQALLWNYNQVIRICMAGHEMIEYNRQLSDQVFSELRGEEIGA